MSSIASKNLLRRYLYPDVIFVYIVKSISKSFNPFHFGFAAAVSMILKTDQATSDSFSAYCQIAVHMLCTFSHNF
jgi:hypothetical protein